MLEGADGPRLYELSELGRRSRRSSCVSFSISQRDDKRDDEEEEEDEGSDEEAILVGRTNNADHED